MKYRIIEECNGNGDSKYFVELYERGLFGHKWQIVERYTTDWTFMVPWKFSSKAEALNHLKEITFTKTIVAEGEL